MARRKPREDLSPASRIVIVVVVALVALAVLIFTLSRPPGSKVEIELPFGAPGTTQPTDSSK
jgi:hypothetical protein